MKTGKRQLSITFLLVILMAVFLGTCCSSCKMFRHVTKQSSSIDTSTVIVHTQESEVTIDASTSTGSVTNIDFTDSSITRIVDEYTKTDYYDTSGNITKSETKGTKTETKHANKKQSTTITDTVSNKGTFVSKAKEKDSTSKKGITATASKEADAGAKTTFGGYTLILLGIVAMLLILFVVYKRYRNKVKQALP